MSPKVVSAKVDREREEKGSKFALPTNDKKQKQKQKQKNTTSSLSNEGEHRKGHHSWVLLFPISFEESD